jgi:hypothetical protein
MAARAILRDETRDVLVESRTGSVCLGSYESGCSGSQQESFPDNHESPQIQTLNQ